MSQRKRSSEGRDGVPLHRFVLMLADPSKRSKCCSLCDWASNTKYSCSRRHKRISWNPELAPNSALRWRTITPIQPYVPALKSKMWEPPSFTMCSPTNSRCPTFGRAESADMLRRILRIQAPATPATIKKNSRAIHLLRRQMARCNRCPSTSPHAFAVFALSVTT